MKLSLFPFAILTAALLAGCNDKPAPGDAPYGQAAPPSPAVAASAPVLPTAAGTPDAATAAGPAMGGAPTAGGGDGPNAPLTTTPAMDKAIADATTKGDKKVLAAVYAARGTARMTDDKGGRRIKYRMALADFRAALKNDPKNQTAAKNKKQIEDIYTQMGLTIPTE